MGTSYTAHSYGRETSSRHCLSPAHFSPHSKSSTLAIALLWVLWNTCMKRSHTEGVSVRPSTCCAATWHHTAKFGYIWYHGSSLKVLRKCNFSHTGPTSTTLCTRVAHQCRRGPGVPGRGTQTTAANITFCCRRQCEYYLLGYIVKVKKESISVLRIKRV
jgi:hypothetical protein